MNVRHYNRHNEENRKRGKRRPKRQDVADGERLFYQRFGREG
jgi:hypothetical protein